LNWLNYYRREQKKQSYPKNKIVLHQLPRGLRAPSASPYCLKLETWIRLAKLDYQNDLGYISSPEGKFPWISDVSEDGEVLDVSDSQFCIEYLSEKHGINLSKHLSEKEQAIARAVVKMLEESFIWVAKLHRFVYQKDYTEVGMPSILGYYIGTKVKTETYYQGYGRHTKEQVYAIGKADLKTINDIIGDNKFLMGSQPCDADASVFGFVTQILYHSTGVLYDYLKADCPNLLRYVETIKNEFWKDWDDNTKEGCKKNN